MSQEEKDIVELSKNCLATAKDLKVSKHSDHIEGGPRTCMCEAATELYTGEYAGGMPEVCRAVLQQDLLNELGKLRLDSRHGFHQALNKGVRAL